MNAKKKRNGNIRECWNCAGSKLTQHQESVFEGGEFKHRTVLKPCRICCPPKKEGSEEKQERRGRGKRLN